MQNDVFDLKILSREGTIFDGKAQSITSYNEEGKFDVLASHANFISLIQKKIDIVDVSGKNISIDLTSGLMKVVQNEVKIYVGLEGVMSFPAPQPTN
jgi:F0F1-type ATP synthase epsilon subunit